MNKLTREYLDEIHGDALLESQDDLDERLAYEHDAEQGVDDSEAKRWMYGMLTAEDTTDDIILVQSRAGGWEDGLGEFYPNGWYWHDAKADALRGPFNSESDAVVDSLVEKDDWT